MLNTLLADISWYEVLVRLLTTVLIIIVVTWSVELFGPLVGGVLAGLPITLGPGFYFLVGDAPESFIVQAASYALLSLCATQGFLLAYILASRRMPPAASLLCALGAWLLLALILHELPSSLLLAALLFVLTTWACIRVARFQLPSESARRGKTGVPSLLLRGVLAGVLVAVVTGSSHRLGPVISGLLLSFPIGYTVISFTLHQQQGRVTTVRTLYSALFGTTSLASFCVVLALTIPAFAPYVALFIALAASAGVTSGLVIWRRLGGRAIGRHGA